jgi:flagellar basal body-associated protein FliL
MPNQELINWIKEQKSKGFSDKEIFDYYLQSGGSKDQYDAAMVSLQPVTTTPQQPVAASVQQPKVLSKQPIRKRKKGKKIVLLIFLIFLIIIAGAVYYLLTSKNESINNLIQGFLSKEEVTDSVYDCNVEDDKIKKLTKNFDDSKLELNKLKQEKEDLVNKINDLSSTEKTVEEKIEYYLDCENPTEKCDLMYKNENGEEDEIFIENVYSIMDGDPQGNWRYINTINNKFIVIEHTHPTPEGCGQFEGLYALDIESKEAKNISLMNNNIECGLEDYLVARKTLIKEALENFKECLSNF